MPFHFLFLLLRKTTLTLYSCFFSIYLHIDKQHAYSTISCFIYILITYICCPLTFLCERYLTCLHVSLLPSLAHTFRSCRRPFSWFLTLKIHIYVYITMIIIPEVNNDIRSHFFSYTTFFFSSGASDYLFFCLPSFYVPYFIIEI